MPVFMILVVKAHARVIFLGWYVRRPSGYSGIQAGRHTILMREATSEPYGPRVYFSNILLSDLRFLHSLFLDLENQKTKNILLHIYSFYLCS